MITYNHASYIQLAIEGVLMQRTSFEVQLIIADDCSPDNTEKIVRDLMDTNPNGHWINYFRHEKNIGMQANGDFVSKYYHGKYIAICEGDDYWTDPFKLQKQVDFLECHKEFILCTHNYSIFNQSTNQLLSENKFENSFEYSLDIYFDNHYTPTLTSVWRNIFKDYPFLKRGEYFSDFYLFFELLKHGKGYFMVDNMANYRVHDQGVCSSLSEEQKIMNHILMLEDLYVNNSYNLEVKKHLARYNLVYFNFCLRTENDRFPKLKYLFKYFKYETSTQKKLTVLFVKLPYYIIRYWLRNLLSYNSR